jgi:hypothetical protein
MRVVQSWHIFRHRLVGLQFIVVDPLESRELVLAYSEGLLRFTHLDAISSSSGADYQFRATRQ